jgi:hypothetical protein
MFSPSESGSESHLSRGYPLTSVSNFSKIVAAHQNHESGTKKPGGEKTKGRPLPSVSDFSKIVATSRRPESRKHTRRGKTQKGEVIHCCATSPRRKGDSKAIPLLDHPRFHGLRPHSPLGLRQGRSAPHPLTPKACRPCESLPKGCHPWNPHLMGLPPLKNPGKRTCRPYLTLPRGWPPWNRPFQGRAVPLTLAVGFGPPLPSRPNRAPVECAKACPFGFGHPGLPPVPPPKV